MVHAWCHHGTWQHARRVRHADGAGTHCAATLCTCQPTATRSRTRRGPPRADPGPQTTSTQVSSIRPCRRATTARARERNGTHGRSASPSAPPPLSLLPPSQSVSTLSSHHASTHSKPLSKHGQATPFSSHRERNIPRRQRLCSEIWCGGGGRHPTRAWPITHPSQHTGIARAPARLVTAWPPSASGREQARRASCSTVAPSSSCHPSRREQCRRAPSLRRGPPSWSSAPNPAWPWPWWGRR